MYVYEQYYFYLVYYYKLAYDLFICKTILLKSTNFRLSFFIDF